MVMVTVMVTAMDTDIILERGPLMPSPLLMPNPLLPLSPDMLMAVMVSVMLTVMVVLMDTDTPMLMLDTITAKDLLNPLLSPLLLLNLDTVTVMLTVTDTDTDMVTVMLTVTVMASKFILLSFLSNYYKGCVYKKFYDWRILICDPQYLKLSL